MQTFLPYSNFIDSAFILDKKRCWKQVVEASQIINVLEGKTTAWANHPAVKMWFGHSESLKDYFNTFLGVCIHKHKINTVYRMFDTKPHYNYPWWLGTNLSIVE